MTPKHTPGPWDVCDASGDGYLYIERNDPEHGCYTIAALNEAFEMSRSRATHEANARLIAAAPDLLAALENARIALTFYREWMTDHGAANGSTTYPFGIKAEDAARAAIAKAQGNEVAK